MFYQQVSESHLGLLCLLGVMVVVVVVIVVLGPEVHHLHEVVLLEGVGAHVVAVPGPDHGTGARLLAPGTGLATPNTSLASGASNEDKVANLQNIVIGQIGDVVE